MGARFVVHYYSFLLIVFIIGLTGCAVPELPETLEVSVSAADKASAARDSGSQSLADSSWAAFRKADPAAAVKQFPPGPYGGLLNGGILERPPVDDQMFIVTFGDEGQMTLIEENKYFLPSIYGTDIPVDDDWVPATVPLLSFRSAAYGAQVDDRFGTAVVVQVQFAGIYVGRAIIYAWGTGGDDRIDGTYGYLLDFAGGLGDLLLDSGGDQYPFYGLREP